MTHPSLGFSESIGIWKCWFLRRGENWSTRRKTSQNKDENQQQTQPTFDAQSENQTWATLVRGLHGGKMLNHCAIPAPPLVRISYAESITSSNKKMTDILFFVSETGILSKRKSELPQQISFFLSLLVTVTKNLSIKNKIAFLSQEKDVHSMVVSRIVY